MNLFESIKANLKESAFVLDDYKTFKNNIWNAFEQYEEDMLDDDDDVFGGTEDSYANEMLGQHLGDYLYDILTELKPEDEAGRWTNFFINELIDLYNQNPDSEMVIQRIYATLQDFIKKGNQPIKEAESYTDEEKEEFELDDEGYDANGEKWIHCEWCEDLQPVSELKKEKNLGWICDRCQSALYSRGEKPVYDEYAIYEESESSDYQKFVDASRNAYKENNLEEAYKYWCKLHDMVDNKLNQVDEKDDKARFNCWKEFQSYIDQFPSEEIYAITDYGKNKIYREEGLIESEKSLEDKCKEIFNKYRDEFDTVNDVRDIADYLNKLYSEEGIQAVNDWFLSSATEEYKKDLKSLINKK